MDWGNTCYWKTKIEAIESLLNELLRQNRIKKLHNKG
jgi:hypothetical protein